MSHYLEINERGRMTLNVLEDRFCPHCSNMGIVVLDGFPQEMGAPCPMCERGMKFDNSDKAGIPGAVAWWDGGRNAIDYSWNNGKTINHFVCGECDSWDSHRPHDCATTRERHAAGVTEALTRLAVYAGRPAPTKELAAQLLRTLGAQRRSAKERQAIKKRVERARTRLEEAEKHVF